MTVESQIISKLESAFAPAHLSVDNESHQHAVAPGSETHFKLTLVSDSFEGLGLVKRHQAVYKVLSDELANGVHALALHTFTLSEWEKNQRSLNSPKCLGGG